MSRGIIRSAKSSGSKAVTKLINGNTIYIQILHKASLIVYMIITTLDTTLITTVIYKIVIIDMNMRIKR